MKIKKRKNNKNYFFNKFLESTTQNNKNVLCLKFIGKKAQSLSAHMRGCAKYKATLKKEKPENNEICIETE